MGSCCKLIHSVSSVWRRCLGKMFLGSQMHLLSMYDFEKSYSKEASCCCSIAQSHPTLHEPIDCRMPGFPVFPSSDSWPLSQWCHPTISSSVTPFSCLQSFTASGSFPVSRLFTSGGQRIGALASASVLSINIQDWFPLGLTGFISLESKGLSRVFSSTTVQKR